jgi:isopenicillin-N N-acyltransferase like protein
MTTNINRRSFFSKAAAGLLGATLLPNLACQRRREPGMPGQAEVDHGFEFLDVTGKPYEVGKTIGKRFGLKIKQGLERRKDWYTEIRSFMQQDLANRFEPFLAAGRRYFPEIVEELSGLADGSEIDFKDLMALNLKAELSAMMDTEKEETPGCSTLCLAEGKRLLIAHNEDGHRAYSDLMFLVKISQPGKPTFLCLTYPGILCGNGPAMNSAGLVVTTNFISGLAVRPGVPRYFVSRALLNADNLKQAVEIVTHPERAFSFHFNIGSKNEQKILSVETSVEQSKTYEVRGLYLHTNHLLLERMQATAQDKSYVETSSMSRYQVLSKLVKEQNCHLKDLTGKDLTKMLAAHENSPYSPCRHPTADVAGATLASTVFDVSEGSLRLYQGNPCKNRSTLMQLD